MDAKQILTKIKQVNHLPFNYQHIEVMATEESVKEGTVEVIKPIAIADYNTTFYQTGPHFKPISKIIDFEPLSESFKK